MPYDTVSLFENPIWIISTFWVKIMNSDKTRMHSTNFLIIGSEWDNFLFINTLWNLVSHTVWVIWGGTNYSRNIGHKGDQTCLERWSHRLPGMCGTLVKLGTTYAWNLSQIGDQTLWSRHPWNIWKFKIVFYEPRTLQVRSDWLKLWTIKNWIFWLNQIRPNVYEVRRIWVLEFSNVPGMSGPQSD